MTFHEDRENQQERKMLAEPNNLRQSFADEENNCSLRRREADCEKHDLLGAFGISHAAQAAGYYQGSGHRTKEKGDASRDFRTPWRLGRLQRQRWTQIYRDS